MLHGGSALLDAVADSEVWRGFSFFSSHELSQFGQHGSTLSQPMETACGCTCALETDFFLSSLRWGCLLLSEDHGNASWQLVGFQLASGAALCHSFSSG